MLVPEELPHDDVGEGADEVHEAPVGGVVQPVVPRRRVVSLELARRRVAEDDHLQEKDTGSVKGYCSRDVQDNRGSHRQRESAGESAGKQENGRGL